MGFYNLEALKNLDVSKIPRQYEGMMSVPVQLKVLDLYTGKPASLTSFSIFVNLYHGGVKTATMCLTLLPSQCGALYLSNMWTTPLTIWGNTRKKYWFQKYVWPVFKSYFKAAGYSRIIMTVEKSQLNCLKHIIKEDHWKKLSVWKNTRTGNTIYTFEMNVTNLKTE